MGNFETCPNSIKLAVALLGTIQKEDQNRPEFFPITYGFKLIVWCMGSGRTPVETSVIGGFAAT
jgi:hypothetical protein